MSLMFGNATVAGFVDLVRYRHFGGNPHSPVSGFYSMESRKDINRRI